MADMQQHGRAGVMEGEELVNHRLQAHLVRVTGELEGRSWGDTIFSTFPVLSAGGG